MLFIDDPKISNVVFYPRKTPIPSNIPKFINPLKFKISENILIGGYFYIQDKNFPSILFFHGNGEVALDYQYFYQAFFDIGVNFAVMDYRGYGHSTAKPVFSSLITDALPIYDEFQKLIIKEGFKNSIFIQGRSLGSVCASEIGFHNPENVRGIIFESGFGSIYNMMTRLFGVRGPNITPETLKKYSNDFRIGKIRKPTLIIHGTMDWIIPPEEAHIIYEALSNDIDKKLILIEGAGHNDIFSYQDEYFNPLKEFIKKFQ